MSPFVALPPICNAAFSVSLPMCLAAERIARQITEVFPGMRIATVHDFSAIDVTRVSELICIDRTTIRNIVARLEAKKVLLRKDDPNDKRA